MKKFYFTLCCLFIVGALFTLTGCHNCNYSQYKVVKEATCTEEGSKIRYCKDDSSHSETQVIPALGHSFGEWQEIVAPTLDSVGQSERKCSRCDKLETKTINLTTTFEDLYANALAGDQKIYLANDIEITDTIYITDKTEIVLLNNVTLTRSANFLGDMFVIGENQNNENMIIYGKVPELVLNRNSNFELIIDGNKSNVVGEVNGSAFVVLYSSKLEMNSNVTIQNCKKSANKRFIENDYALKNITKIGGAAVVIVNGTFTMNGGLITNCEVNVVNDDTNATACYGGAIYNFSTVTVGGDSIISNCSATRGGAIYNYRTCTITQARFEFNTASLYAGAVYLTESQYTTLDIGDMLNQSSDIKQVKIVFEENTSDKSGGAIFGQMKTSINIYGNTKFIKNKSIASNGGAISTSGALTIHYASFENNQAASKGGAIYAYYSNPELTERIVTIYQGSFTENSAARGGAIVFSSSEAEYEKGSKGFIGKVEFISNRAFTTSTSDPELNDGDIGSGSYYGYGGAIYASRKSQITIDGATFVTNISESKGGAIYATALSNIEILNTAFNNNSSSGNGGAIYAYTDSSVYPDNNTKISISKTNFNLNVSNSLSYGGGAVYLTGAIAEIDDVEFTENFSKYNGGAIAAYSNSYLSVIKVKMNDNICENHGGAIYTNDSFVTATEFTLNNNTANVHGGALYFKDTTSTIVTLTCNGNLAQGNAGAFYVSGGTINVDGITANNNQSNGTGGGVFYITSTSTNDIKATVTLDNILATENKAVSGGFIYITTTGSKVIILGGQAINNSALTNENGNTIWSNTNKCTIVINGGVNGTEFIYDQDGIKGKLTIEEL